jgi:hypothetical protein
MILAGQPFQATQAIAAKEIGVLQIHRGEKGRRSRGSTSRRIVIKHRAPRRALSQVAGPAVRRGPLLPRPLTVSGTGKRRAGISRLPSSALTELIASAVVTTSKKTCRVRFIIALHDIVTVPSR